MRKIYIVLVVVIFLIESLCLLRQYQKAADNSYSHAWTVIGMLRGFTPPPESSIPEDKKLIEFLLKTNESLAKEVLSDYPNHPSAPQYVTIQRQFFEQHKKYKIPDIIQQAIKNGYDKKESNHLFYNDLYVLKNWLGN
jgi:hypothetical protein